MSLRPTSISEELNQPNLRSDKLKFLWYVSQKGYYFGTGNLQNVTSIAHYIIGEYKSIKNTDMYLLLITIVFCIPALTLKPEEIMTYIPRHVPAVFLWHGARIFYTSASIFRRRGISNYRDPKLFTWQGFDDSALLSWYFRTVVCAIFLKISTFL